MNPGITSTIPPIRSRFQARIPGGTMTTEMPSQPTEPPAAPPPLPTTPPAAPKRPLTSLVAGLLGLAVGAGLVGGAWAITSRGTVPTEAETFTLTGTFTLTKGATPTKDDSCMGYGGYGDIAAGTSVTVYDAAGGVTATGSLGVSKYSVGACAFVVTVEDVPKGEKFYQVEVSHRGKVQLTAEEAEGGEFGATLG